MSDMIEKVARAICCARTQCDNCGCRSGHDCFDLALWDEEAQAAIQAHTAALIEGAGELCERLLDHGHITQRDGLAALLSTCAQAAATIAALREELARVKPPEHYVRLGIKAAAAKAMAYRDWVNWTGDTFPDEPGTSILALDAAAIARRDTALSELAEHDAVLIDGEPQ